MAKLTPMMQQYMDIKNQYKDTLLLFRLGDFYELFFEDALLASRELEITLTGRDCGQESRAPMCGVPYHSVDSYIDRLISKGYKVAICEQVEDPAQAVGIVKRDVVRIITPGTVIDTQLLEDKKNNYIMSLYGDGRGWGITYGDITTGELFTTEIKETAPQRLLDEIGRIQPKELIYFFEGVQTEETEEILIAVKRLDAIANPHDAWSYEESFAVNQIKEHFKVIALDGLGFTEKHIGLQSTGALLDYLRSTQKRYLSHINKIKVYSLAESMVLDLTTRRNLELTETIRNKSKKGSLLWVLDKTATSMGGRMLRKWIEAPLLSVNEINRRLDAVEALKDALLTRKELKEDLKSIYDIERLAARVSFGSANPRDLIALKSSINKLPAIKERLSEFQDGLLKDIYNEIDPLEDIGGLIDIAIKEEPPVALKEGGIIKAGYNDEVDQLQAAARDGKHWLAELERVERDKTGIKSLKIGFNKVFGYFIEITNSYIKNAPDYYMRKQTLANCERYITPELKEMESKILGAEERVVSLEYQLFIDVRNSIALEVERLQKTASAIAVLDAIYSLAEVAEDCGFVKPNITQTGEICIKEGRHPVVEKTLQNQMFIPNDTFMDTGKHQISVITGPNMAGKSTYMRQVAIIVLMAQVGSFIPANSGEISIVDRIFTRVGASDDLSQGQSTFMVEMTEMANILNSATANSLLILDEIGRGTSTFDGLSIAWSVIEYISRHHKGKTLFSTHYHELTELEGKIKGVKNYRISVKEDGEDIIFLRRIIEGSADKSYGIQVAKLAGLPKEVINRANEILHQLEENDITLIDQGIIREGLNEAVISIEEDHQMDFYSLYQNEILEELRYINLLETTPIDALNYLAKLQKKLSSINQGGK